MKKYILPWIGMLALVATPVFAQGLDPRDSGLFVDFSASAGSNSPQDVVVYISQVLLGLVALVSMIYIIYGGYMYLTAGINADQAAQGRKIVRNALIGLIVVILSYIIVSVVVNSLFNL